MDRYPVFSLLPRSFWLSSELGSVYKPALAWGHQKVADETLRIFQKLRRIEHTDQWGRVKCFTCGEVFQWNRGCEGGHYMSRRKKATALLDCNVNPQCTACNNFGSGEQSLYREAFIKRWGQDNHDLLVRQSNESYQFNRPVQLEWLEFRQHCLAEVRFHVQRLNGQACF